MKNVSANFFKVGKLDKAEKIFKRIDAFFKSKDAKTNYEEEDEQTTTYRDATLALEALQIGNLTNLALVMFKKDNLQKCIENCDQALELDHRNIKALFWKGRANAEDAEYETAIQIYQSILEIEPDHAETKKYLKEVQLKNQEY